MATMDRDALRALVFRIEALPTPERDTPAWVDTENLYRTLVEQILTVAIADERGLPTDQYDGTPDAIDAILMGERESSDASFAVACVKSAVHRRPDLAGAISHLDGFALFTTKYKAWILGGPWVFGRQRSTVTPGT